MVGSELGNLNQMKISAKDRRHNRVKCKKATSRGLKVGKFYL